MRYHTIKNYEGLDIGANLQLPASSFQSMSENTKGFEIAFNLQAKILRLRVWGEWDDGLKKKCDMALRDKIIELSVHAHWQIWYVLLDFTRFLLPSEEIQGAIEHQLIAEKALGIRKIACVQNNFTPDMPRQHERDGPRYALFTSSREAIKWLLNGLSQEVRKNNNNT